MQIYDVLKQDHDKLKVLLTELVASADADEGQRKELINKIRDELIPHSRAEEAVFYNSLRDLDEEKGLATHGYKEHMEAETLLRSLQTMEAFDANWRNTAQKLKDAIENHVREEETDFFAAGKRVFDEKEAEMMAQAFEQLKPEVQEQGIMGNAIDMVANMMPDRLAEKIRDYNHRS